MGRLLVVGRLLQFNGGVPVGRLLLFGRLLVFGGGDPVGRLLGFGGLLIWGVICFGAIIAVSGKMFKERRHFGHM